MSEAFVKIDLHGLRQEEAIKAIDKAIAAAGPATYHLQLIHGYNRGTSLRSMIYDWYQYDPKVKRIMPGDNYHGTGAEGAVLMKIMVSVCLAGENCRYNGRKSRI